VSTPQCFPLGDTSTTNNFLETLRVERKCWETFLRYFDVLDKGEPSNLAAECFTLDANVTYEMKGSPLVMESRADYAKFLETATAAQEMAVHFVGQHIFEWREGTPYLRSNVMSWQWFTKNADAGVLRPADFATIGHAIDEFREVDGRWLISKRHGRPPPASTRSVPHRSHRRPGSSKDRL
jgi:hypothetical protein